MDRAVLEGDPHRVLEGMMIAGIAIGASQGLIYVRAEYPLAVKRLQLAINELREKKLLGENILNSGFNFDFSIMMGAGAFVCGEETALLASLGGNRGMPVTKPPFPAQKGFRKQPTNINNVETFANVSWIIENGGSAFASMGTENSKGTKVFALAGRVKRGGLVEVPMGITIEKIVFDICGGIIGDADVKAVQMGGPSGGCIPKELLSTPIEYESIAKTGAIMGSGGMVVMDENTCMVDMAKFFMDFTSKESCGKCVPCRIGTTRMLEILERIVDGKGAESDIDVLLELAESIKTGALCGLGNSAPNPVLTTIKYFKDEYLAHINEKKCPAKKCTALISYRIDETLCKGCSLCSRKCPQNAISGEVKKPFVIDNEKCIRCGQCIIGCKFGAIKIESGVK
jgi:NADH-quinone oxidoreductase subunit F